MASAEHDAVIARTRAWLRRAVIGLNLCPFAKAVDAKDRIRYVVTDAQDPEALLEQLCAELQLLADADPDRLDTTLLIHPQALTDFGAYNDFLDVADAALEALGVDGVLQVASFHPRYRFAGLGTNALEHATNRSPYPMLHLLREASVDRAVAAYPSAEPIVEANRRTLRGLGRAGWAALQAEIERDVAASAAAAPAPSRRRAAR